MAKKQSFPSYFKDQVKEGMGGAIKSIGKWAKAAAKVAWGVAKEIWRWAKAHADWIKKARESTWAGKAATASVITKKARAALKK